MAEALGLTASLVAVLQITQSVLSVCYDYSAALKGSSWELTKVKDELEGFRTVVQALEPLIREADLSSPTLTTRLPTLDAICAPGGVLQSCRADLEYLAKKLELPDIGRRSKALLQSLKWPLQESETKKILDRLARRRGLLELALDVDHTKLSLALQNLGLQTNEEVHGMKKIAEEARDKAELQMIEEEKRRFHAWLSAPNPSINHNRAQQSHIRDTGSWFLNSDQFTRWKQRRLVTWLYGIPGCGKTILSSTIIGAIREEYGPANDIAVLYFYFDFNDAQKQDATYMVRSLLSQLLECSSLSLVRQRIRSLYTMCSNGTSEPNLKSLYTTLREIIRDLSDTFIILDALDECGERKQLYNVIKQIRQFDPQKSHILLTSRRLTDIEESLGLLVDEADKVPVEGAPMDSDILTYVEERLDTDPDLNRWKKSPDVQTEIRTKLLEKAGGMFRWAVCQLDVLRNCTRLPTLRKALADLPKTLDETYSRILCSIPEESIDDVLKMLQWLVYSQRPLSVMELAEVVAINTNGDPWVDADARFPEPSDVFTILSSLVTTEDDASKLKTQRVRFAHFSVKEYLVSDRILLSKAAGKFAIRDTTARKYLAEATCAYLLHLADCDDERELSECQVDYPLLIYVSSKWVQHLLLLGKDEIPRELLMRLLLRIELPRTVYIDILVKLSRVVSRDMLNEIMDDGDDDEVLVKRVLQRQLARVFKKVAKSRILIRSVLVGNNGDAPVCHPLGFAAWAGDLELVQELLKNGHDINVQVRQYGGTLNAALEGFADEDLLQLLLANGSDVNARHECYPKMTPLHTAVSRRNKPAVRLLLQNGANVNSDSDKGSPLHIALKDGGLDISRLLLQHGADVHNDLLDRAPLLTVLPSRIEYSDLRSVVELLLEYGADVNVVGAHGDTALCLSLQRDYAVITDLLLAHGADVNSHAENGDTALLIAVYKGNKTHTQKLLERGADINAKGSSGTVITVACERGSDDMVQLLLDWGAEATFEEDFMGLRYWQPGSAAKDGRKS